jgi:hypothetical protein
MYLRCYRLGGEVTISSTTGFHIDTLFKISFHSSTSPEVSTFPKKRT